LPEQRLKGMRMVTTEHKGISREAIHKAVDELPDESLDELQVFVAYLHHKQTHPGSAWARTLYDVFAPVRAAIAQTDMTEAEIDQIIDEAIDEVRRG
jgi:hypothetical protein